MLRVLVLGVGVWAGASLVACSSDTNRKTPPAPPMPHDTPLARRDGPFRLDWAMQPLWEDGQAEVARYNAEQVVAGEVRRFVLTQTTSRQEFAQQSDTRTTQRGRKDAFPVMQVTQQYTLPTAAEPSQVQVCLIFRRDQPVQLHKLTTAVQEWAGTCFTAITDDGLQFRQQYNSAREGEGTGQRTLQRHALLEAALPYSLRTLRFTSRPAFEARVYGQPPAVGATPPPLYRAHIRVEDGAAPDSLQPAWCVRVQLDSARQNVYWFAKSYPHVLLRYACWDGRRGWLQQLRRQPLPAAAPPDSVAAAAGRPASQAR